MSLTGQFSNMYHPLSSQLIKNQAKAAQDSNKVGPAEKKDEEDKRVTAPAQQPIRTSATAPQQLAPRTSSALAGAPRRKVNPTNERAVNDNTPDTTRAMAGGSDRLLRSQSKTQTGPTGAPAARSQQNWY
jgi:hypothetical protein